MTDQFKIITTFILDIDGVLTDGTVLIMENGQQARRMSIKDGYALQLAIKTGYNIHVISGAVISPVVERLNKLGIKDVHFSVLNKKAFVQDIISRNNLKAEEVLYMGDDIPDLPAMKIVGFAACPSDAAKEIRDISKYISPYPGGSGCVRDVIEKVLQSKSQWYHEPDVPSA